MNEYLTVKDLAERFNLTPSAIRYWLEQGLIRGTKLHSRLWLIDPAAVEEAVEAGRVPPKAGRPRKGAK